MNIVEPRTAELASDVRIAVGRLARRLRKEKAQHDLSDSMFTVLAYLFRDGAKTLGELAEYEQVKPPSMTRTVNCLVDEGLAERMPDARDGRVTRIRPTERGAELVREVRESRNAWLVQQLTDLTADERATLADAAAILRRLTD